MSPDIGRTHWLCELCDRISWHSLQWLWWQDHSSLESIWQMHSNSPNREEGGFVKILDGRLYCGCNNGNLIFLAKVKRNLFSFFFSQIFQSLHFVETRKPQYILKRNQGKNQSIILGHVFHKEETRNIFASATQGNPFHNFSSHCYYIFERKYCAVNLAAYFIISSQLTNDV